jgi:hypothetical protein
LPPGVKIFAHALQGAFHVRRHGLRGLKVRPARRAPLFLVGMAFYG